jgi:hypothetical protein
MLTKNSDAGQASADDVGGHARERFLIKPGMTWEDLRPAFGGIFASVDTSLPNEIIARIAPSPHL